MVPPAVSRYVAQTIVNWQAPADDQEARTWLESVEAVLLAHKDSTDLAGFISAHLIPFLRGANERLGRVYQRTVEFLEEREAERRAQEQPEANSLHEQD